MARTLTVEIIGDASSFEKALGKAGKSTSSFGDKVKKGAAVAGAAIGGGLAIAAKIGFDEFKQGQLVAAQTEAVLKSTGGAANVTAEQVDKLAGSLMKKSGVDDEAIKSGSNMLLTFTKIRNETGKGNKIFDQATRATLDLSVAMGKDMQSSAVLVGKALNDPVKGMSALSKAGIQFTKQQKAQITAMAESGNVMGAQKKILAELTTQFGGSAEAAGKTLPGQINILRESFSNFAGELVAKVIPKLVAIVGFFREHTTVAKILGGVIAGTVGVMIAAGAAMKIYGAVTAATTAFKWLFITAVNAETGAVTRASFASKVARAATLGWAGAQWLLNAALLANPIGLIVIGLVALGAALFIAWKKSETFRNVVTGAWEAIRDVTVAVFDKVRDVIGGAVDFIGGLVSKHPLVWLITHFDEVKDKVISTVGALPGAVWEKIEAIGARIAQGWETILAWGTGVGSRVKSAAVNAVLGIGNDVWGVIDNIGSKLVEMAATVIGWGTAVGTHVKNAAVAGVTGIGGLVWGVIDNIGARILEGAETIVGWGRGVGSRIKDAAVDAIVGIGSAVWDKVNNIWEFLLDKKDTIVGWGKKIGGWMKDAIIDAFQGLAGGIWDAIKGIPGAIGDKAGSAWGGRGREPIPSQGPVGSGRLDISPKLWDELAFGHRMGLSVSPEGGYRPGDDGDHGKYPSHAIDMVGAQMSRFASAMYGRSGIKDVIYGPHPFWQDNGRIVSWAGFEDLRRDHAGANVHVHASVFDRGGVLAPGLNLVANMTGRPEPVVPAMAAAPAGTPTVVETHITLELDGEVLWKKLERSVIRDQMRNGNVMPWQIRGPGF